MGTISKPNTYATGATILAAELNANEDALFNWANGNVDNANVKASANINLSKINKTTDVTWTGEVTFSKSDTDPCVNFANSGNGPHANLSGDPTVASPTDGDFWFTGSNLNFRNGTSTVNLLASTNKHYRRGFRIKAGTTEDAMITVEPGTIDVGGVIVSATGVNADINIATASNWKDGSAPSLTSTWIYVLIDNAGNIKLDENPPAYSYIDETTAEIPLRYHKQTTTYYRYLASIFSDAAGDLCWGHSGSEGLYVSQFDATNQCIINGVGTGADQTFNTIWTPKQVHVIYGANDATPAAGEALDEHIATQKMLDTNWYGTSLNAHDASDWVAITTAGTVNAIVQQSAGTSGSFTIDSMTDGYYFYAIAFTDEL